MYTNSGKISRIVSVVALSLFATSYVSTHGSPDESESLEYITALPSNFSKEQLEMLKWNKSSEPIKRKNELLVDQNSGSIKPLIPKRAFKKFDDHSTHEHAIGYVNGQFFGAEAVINIWWPVVENADEFSLAQMWILSGSLDDGNLNSIEVGWQVVPPNGYSRIFIFWTRDAYHTTGCYNLECPGFVQKHKTIKPGIRIRLPSVYNGKQYEIHFSVLKNPMDGNWWLLLDGTPIGYWPSYIFTSLSDHASELQFGGEIVNTEKNGQHTTQMGSGHFPNEGFRKAAYIRSIQVFDKVQGKLVPAPPLLGFFDKQNCYWAGYGSKTDETWGTYIFFGGPGRNPNCP